MFEITKNVGNFCGEESFFAIKIVFDFFLECSRKPHFPLL